MTWTAADAPREEGDDGGLGAGPTWEPLAPGALGAAPRPAAVGELPGALFGDLPPLPLTGPLADALTTARTALDQAVTATTHLTSLGPTQRLDALRQLATTRHTTDAAIARLATSFTPDDVRALGATDPVDLLATHTGADPRNAAATLKLATALTAPPVQPPAAHTDEDADGADEGGDDPDGAATTPGVDAGPGAGSSRVALGLLGAAHAAGTVSTDIAALAQRTLADLPARIRRACMPTADAYLAEALPGLSHTQAQLVCTTLAHTLDPDRADRGFDPDDLERRSTHVTVHSDGWVDVRARFDPVTGAWVKATLDAASKPAPTVTAPLADTPDDGQGELDGLSGAQDDADAAAGSDGGAAQGAPGGVRVRDERTAPQRRADALAALLKSGAAGDHGPNAAGTAAPGGLGARVIVTTTAEALTGGTGAAPAHCETTGRPLTTAALRTIACSASLQAVRLSCDGADAAVLSLGRTVRLFTATQRRAMLARDGGCVIPGCTSPPGWWEAHHVHEWAAGGPTDVASGVLVCTRHHILVTLGIWQVRMVDGVPQVRPPRTVDPLRRWVLNPRRGLRARTARAARQMRLGLDLDGPPGDPPEAPDIPSPRGTCAC
ncbi:HNH endonuclease signature motif containing protein [Quadrisphaera sp. INWT6]|uniref:HNH endonuclease signature motif containing protein n=1 Tax=Quadrisphaera sp. INWT6 TaxID=2596917 RepID=UPI001891F4EC|nr:HNH endonuclease signature motif containing protein [Quadrisphaera sp. INWT6]MBF5083437.1 DUF222 domain-containing protein [Quadrisphaera sp. INWT6]